MGKQTIFMVEDDATIIQVVSEKLNSWGYACKGVTDFQNVLSECLELDPQLVLLDISLPYFNGFHWCRKLSKFAL